MKVSLTDDVVEKFKTDTGEYFRTREPIEIWIKRFGYTPVYLGRPYNQQIHEWLIKNVGNKFILSRVNSLISENSVIVFATKKDAAWFSLVCL